MKIGYARVSTADQSLDMQLDALKAAGCERIYTKKASGAKDDRTELQRVLDTLRPGDVFVVYKLDRPASIMTSSRWNTINRSQSEELISQTNQGVCLLI